MENKIKIGLIVFGIIILMVACSSMLGYRPEEFQQGLMIGLIFGMGLGLLFMYYTSLYENKKTKIASKFEKSYLILFTVIGIGFGLQLSRIQELYQMPISIYNLGHILFFVGLTGVIILMWKRDKLQNK